MKTSVRTIIPCYNEAKSIGSVINELAIRHPDIKILVIDDGSTDNSFMEAEATGKAEVIRMPVNLGVGGAIQTGLIYANINNDTMAVKLDGDGQHDPQDIAGLLQPLVDGQADIVIGSRFVGENPGFQSTFLRRIGIKILQLVAWILTGQKITDPTSGFRAYNRRAIKFMANNYPSFDYPEPEEIILANKNGLRMIEMPVVMRERQAGISTISSSISIYYMLKVTLAMLFISLREPEEK